MKKEIKDPQNTVKYILYKNNGKLLCHLEKKLPRTKILVLEELDKID